jgi:hypothetical protein
MNLEVKYIGRIISIKLIREFIIDESLFDGKVILLHRLNFDDIILEYRNFYNESIKFPYYIIGVLITEDKSQKIPFDRVGIVNIEDYKAQHILSQKAFDLYDKVKAYRCEFCGRLTDENGNILFGNERDIIISYLKESDNPIVHKIYGKCC